MTAPFKGEVPRTLPHGEYYRPSGRSLSVPPDYEEIL